MVREVIGKDGGDIHDELVLAGETSGRPSSALEVKREGPFSKSHKNLGRYQGH
jgi:hypothetical protein